MRTPQVSDGELLSHFEAKNGGDCNSTYKYWQQKLEEYAEELSNQRSMRFFLFAQHAEPMIGVCNFTQIFRGPFQACYLGYKIDNDFEGKGLMFEALESAIHYMFTVQNLHRIMANYMPNNERSKRLLMRLGFKEEGYAANYLLINNKWEDHVLTALTNPNWSPKI
jgi:ribosomal-protein-alanine N-acetyltransferase